MEQQQDSTSVTRGQNQLHVLPEDPAAAAQVLKPVLERLDASADTLQLLVVTSDADAAAALAARLAGAPTLRVVAATDARRATRVLRRATPHVVIGPADQLGALLGAAALKLDAVRVVVFAWAGGAALDALMADVPKDAARFVLTDVVTPEVEQLVERYAWRARRVQPAGAEPVPAVSLSYVVASDRESALRRVLDALDPASAFVYARDEGSRASVDTALRGLGYGVGGGASEAVRAGSAPAGAFELLVLYDLPAHDEELRTLVRAHSAARIVALVAARQLRALRAMAGGSVTPFTLPDAAVRARSREDRLRDEVRAVLETGQFSREVLTLEPLLVDHDGIEVAAALLRLLEAARNQARAPQLQAQPAGVTRLYLNVGSTDEVRPGDLVGAITGEAGISKSELGRVDVRDRHSTVEVASSVANAVVAKLTGVQIRGRRVIARVDEDKPRERPRRSSGDRGERRGPPRGGRPNRERR